jgi:murein DD-endopeptidase MepM/ murein hydrolase activator NlpD
VYSVFEGVVIGVGDGWPDRVRVNALWELLRGALLARPPIGRDYRPLAGNFVLVEGAVGVALYAHLRKGSVTVHEREKIATGSEIGAVGNSGNSTMPHLHFHLMDGADPHTAAGLPCVFRDYERLDGTRWEFVERGTPARLERVRATL